MDVRPFIPIVAIVMGVGVAFWTLYLEHQRRQLQYEERRLMIEKGMMPPPLPESVPRPLESSLRAGMMLVCLGTGLVVAALFPAIGYLARISGFVAPIVLFLGVGNLAYYFVARKR